MVTNGADGISSQPYLCLVMFTGLAKLYMLDRAADFAFTDKYSGAAVLWLQSPVGLTSSANTWWGQRNPISDTGAQTSESED